MKEADFKRIYPNAPIEMLQRGKAVRMIFFGLPVFVLTSMMLYKRLVLGEEKKVQVGEILDDGSIRLFTANEIEYHDKNSLSTKFFGQDTVDYQAAAAAGSKK